MSNSSVRLVLLVFAFVLFVVSALVIDPHRPKLQSAGLACWVAAQIFA